MSSPLFRRCFANCFHYLRAHYRFDVSRVPSITSKRHHATQMKSDLLLFTPGPLSTTPSVKAAMLRDLGSRDREFIATVRDIRSRLLALAGVKDKAYEAVIVQGSGTFGVESVLTSALPQGGRLLILVNGAYGKRMAQICKVNKIDHVELEFEEAAPVDLKKVQQTLSQDDRITAVAVVHCETSSGRINPIEEIGKFTKEGSSKRIFIVDAMSSFGAIPVNMKDVDFLISSANKCIQGVPGFSFVIAQQPALLACEGNARSLSLDLLAQWKGLEKDGQFRFTPPTHSLLAFHQALLELEKETLVGRGQRYAENRRVLLTGMRQMGFEELLDERLQSFIISSFHYPKSSRFNFDEFCKRLSSSGFVIYPGKVTNASCFRIGTIGNIYPKDVEALLRSIRDIKTDMGF